MQRGSPQLPCLQLQSKRIPVFSSTGCASLRFLSSTFRRFSSVFFSLIKVATAMAHLPVASQQLPSVQKPLRIYFTAE